MSESSPSQAGPSNAPAASAAIDWTLVLSLGAVPLLHPLFSITGWAEWLGRPQTPLALTAVITVIWVAVVAAASTARPVVTLVLAGSVAAIVAAGLSLLVPAVMGGDAANLQDGFGMLATVVATLLVYAAWGALCGLLAAGVRRLGGRRADQA